MNGSTAIQLEVWSDFNCPWCYLGRRHLAVAIADRDDPNPPVVTWRAFQLDPSVPDTGVDAEAYFAARFGSDVGRIEQARERLVAMGEEVGIAFRFDRQRVVANTRLAHKVLAAATREEEHSALLDAIFAANFERGIDIGSPEALHALIVEKLGDVELADGLIAAATGDDTSLDAAVDADLRAAVELGISGVPYVVADRAIAVPGAVPPPVLAQLLDAAASRREDALDSDASA